MQNFKIFLNFREEIDGLAAKHSDQFKVWYTIDQPLADGDWKYSTGYINADMISDHLPVHPSADFVSRPDEFGSKDDFSVVLICGPPPMVKFACIPALDELNVPAENRFTF